MENSMLQFGYKNDKRRKKVAAKCLKKRKA